MPTDRPVVVARGKTNGEGGVEPLQKKPLMALLTGCRSGELLALSWSHVDVDARTVRIGRSLPWDRFGGKGNTKPVITLTTYSHWFDDAREKNREAMGDLATAVLEPSGSKTVATASA
jgi:integrase